MHDGYFFAVQTIGTPFLRPIRGTDEWGSLLSSQLAQPCLSLSLWDGEPTLWARRFEGGACVARLKLPEDAKRAKDGRKRASTDALHPWIVAAENASISRGLLVDGEPGDSGKRRRSTVNLETSAAAVGRAIGMPTQ